MNLWMDFSPEVEKSAGNLCSSGVRREEVKVEKLITATAPVPLDAPGRRV